MKKYRSIFIAVFFCFLWTACHTDRQIDWEEGVYEGQLQNGIPCGYGRWERMSERLSYQGNWKAGRKYGLGVWQRGDTIYRGEFRGDSLCGQGEMILPDGSFYKGSWKNGIREGYGEFTDTLGQIYRGVWTCDSLSKGERTDSLGSFHGSFNMQLHPSGQGDYFTPNGIYYSGHWNDGMRDGFGFSMEPHQVVKCGYWKKNRFQGEQMLYNPSRVYGIDISKYQHIINKRVYAIDWKSLRITHLGSISQKKIQGGKADYPVSFIYIKATEGLTVVNKFYKKDRFQAHRHGYPVGAYHFFSTRPGNRQAAHFLKQATPRRGDLPPMLDVELTDAQIRSMGGAQAMFREILEWMRMVEQRCGTKPVLYISQTFVNQYLLYAPAAIRKYRVWIARYGEFKPYVHLLYWQLSPDGRVRGIRGEVDIDVFNGTQEQFREYVDRECVK